MVKKKHNKQLSVISNPVSQVFEVERMLDQIMTKLSVAQADNQFLAERLQEHYQKKISSYENEIKELVDSIDKLKKVNQSNEQELKKIKNLINEKEKKVTQTISYQLGKALVESTKSVEGFLSLPVNLWNINKQSQLNKSVPQSTRLVKIPVTKSLKKQSDFKSRNNIRFIAILDEISHTSFDSEFKLFPLAKSTFEAQISGSTSAGLFIESCWKGNSGAWEYAFTSPNLQHKNAQDLLKSLEIAKKRDFPIIFWNKEDPMHYDKFLSIASKCDIIFTTDSNKIPDYHRDVPNAKVDALLFAANINLCNPANRFRVEQNSVCFAGSYYGVGHDDRKKQMDALLPSIIKFKGVIYDRMSQVGSDRYSYPKKYLKFIRPAVPFKDIIDVYKQYKVFLNVNTITDSPTMMSRRVYELLACGTPVISTPSLAVDKQFDGIVQVARDAKEANKIIKRLLSNEWEWLRLSHKGYREVMLNHTYEHRAIQIANTLGHEFKLNIPLVSIVMATRRSKFIDRIVTNVTQQTHPNIELIFITQDWEKEKLKELRTKLENSSNKIKGIHIIENNTSDTLGTRLNQGISVSTGDYVAKFDDDDFYFPHYLQDMLIPFKFGDYGIVGKKEVFMYFEDYNATFVRYKGSRHTETDFLSGATLVFSRKALESLRFGDLNRGEDSNILEQAKKSNIGMYAADPFNFIVYRGKDLDQHTWQVNSEFFMSKSEFVGLEFATDITKL